MSDFDICVALQINSGDLKVNKSLIQKVLYTNPDLLELRLDYIEDIALIDKNFIKSLLKFSPQEIPVILTLRDASEGGQIKIAPSKRIDLIKMLIECKPQYLDIEVKTEISILSEIFTLAKQHDIKLIFSSHDFKETASFEEGIKEYEDLVSKKRFIQEGIYKRIYTAQNFEDNFFALKICKELKKRNQEVLCFCMGEEGIFSRIACVNFGAAFTYASVAKITAPGQIHIKKLREAMKLIFQNR